MQLKPWEEQQGIKGSIDNLVYICKRIAYLCLIRLSVVAFSVHEAFMGN